MIGVKPMSYSDEDRAHEERIARWNESKTKSAELLAECDRVLAELRAERQAIDNDPIAWSNRLLAERHAANAIPLPRKPSPEP